MKIKGGEKVTENTVYQVEFTKAEEVAEKGDHARKSKFALWNRFDISNEKMMEMLTDKAKIIMEEHNYDTMVIYKETFEEFVFYKEIENEINEEINK